MKIVTLRNYNDWEAHAEPSDAESAHLSDDELSALIASTYRRALTRAEAKRLATEAYEDATAPRKECRGKAHQGERALPENQRHFSKQGKRTRLDGTPILRSECRECEKASQARLYLARKAKRARESLEPVVD